MLRILKAFLDMRAFIEGLANDASFEFDDACQEAFEILKKALISAPIL